MATVKSIERARIAERAAEINYRSSVRIARRAFESINGTTAVDAPQYTMREYRYYSERAIKARRILDKAAAELDDALSLDMYRVSL